MNRATGLVTAIVVGVLAVRVDSAAQIAAAGAAAAQVGPVTVPPLPPRSRFVQSSGLRATLRVTPETVRVDRSPTFTLVLTNVGRQQMFINPAIRPNLRIYSKAGALVQPLVTVVAERVIVEIESFRRLDPGQSVEFEVMPWFPLPGPSDAEGVYGRHRLRQGEADHGLGIPVGDYVATFTYYNSPDYNFSSTYSVEKAPKEIWEGRLESAPVSFRVQSLDAAAERQLREQLNDGTDPTAAIELLGLGRVTGTIDDLFVRYRRSPFERREIVSAVLTMGEVGCPRLLAFLTTLPEDDWPGQHEWRHLADRCPPIAPWLRSLIQAPPRSDGRRDGPTTRGIAAMALGELRDRRDVPLVATLLNETISGLAENRHDDNRRSAITALRELGGPAAGSVLVAQLQRPERAALLSELVPALWDLGPPGASAAIASALTTADARTVAQALSALGQLGDVSVLPQVRPFAKHEDLQVRLSAVATMMALGDRSLEDTVRPMLNDPALQARIVAINYLGAQDDPSIVPLLWPHLDGAPAESTAAATAILAVADETLFPLLRSRLDGASEESKRRTILQLIGLTFFSEGWNFTAAEWDAWWNARRNRTRAQWAEEAILQRRGWAPVALRYLDGRSSLSPKLLDRAAEWLRVPAADILLKRDRRRAVGLYLSALDSRFVRVCESGVRALNALIEDDIVVDCSDPAARRQAAERFANATLSSR